MRRDPLESMLLASLLFGGVFLVAAVVIFVRNVLLGMVELAQTKPAFVGVCSFLLGFSVVTGPVVAFARRKMGPGRSYRAKNAVTGALVGICYSLGCTVVFSAGMDVTGKVAVGGFTLLGVWWAVASGLNEVFREPQSPG